MSDPRDVGYRPTLDEEFRQVKKSLFASKYRRFFKLEAELAVQLKDLREALSRHQPDIVHYSGHGNDKGLVLQNHVGRRTLIGKRVLAELFKAHPEVRMVVLNACYSAAQLEAITETVDFTIGTKDMVLDPHAVTFAAAFYYELASGRSIDQALTAARAELIGKKAPRSKLPELKMRQGADASFSFIAEPSSRPRKKTAERTPRKPSGLIIAGRDNKHNINIIGDHASVNQGRPKR